MAADTTTSPISNSIRISSTMRSGMRRAGGATSNAASVTCDAVARLLRDIDPLPLPPCGFCFARTVGGEEACSQRNNAEMLNVRAGLGRHFDPRRIVDCEGMGATIATARIAAGQTAGVCPFADRAFGCWRGV